jgi:hypothetical protein
MSLAETLVDLLKKSRDLAPLGDNFQRTLAADTPDGRMAAICAEIGETVLGRKLTFTFGESARLIVDASGRRLMRVLQIEPASVAHSDDPVFESRDDSRLAEQLSSIGRVLAAVCASDGALTVVSDASAEQYSTGSVGYAPDKLYEAAVAAPKIKPTPKVERPVVTNTVVMETPVETPPVKFSPTEAMKAMIREKVQAATNAAAAAAATHPGPAKILPNPVQKGPGPMPDDSLRAFFHEVQEDVSFCAVLNQGGNVEAVGGKDNDERILAFAADVMTDLDHWRDTTTRKLSKDQMIVLKASGIQNRSLALFSAENGAVIVIFLNTDLSRIFAVANKLLVEKRTK